MAVIGGESSRRRLGAESALRGALPRPRRPQRAEHGARRRRAVERVEVDPGRAAGEQLLALPRGVGDAELASASSSPPSASIAGSSSARDRRVAEVADPRHLGEAGDRDHPGDDRHVDPALARRGDEVEVDAVVEEELGDQEAGAGVDLGLQVGEVGLEVGGLGVDLGEAGAADREVVAARR